MGRHGRGRGGAAGRGGRRIVSSAGRRRWRGFSGVHGDGLGHVGGVLPVDWGVVVGHVAALAGEPGWFLVGGPRGQGGGSQGRTIRPVVHLDGGAGSVVAVPVLYARLANHAGGQTYDGREQLKQANYHLNGSIERFLELSLQKKENGSKTTNKSRRSIGKIVEYECEK